VAWQSDNQRKEGELLSEVKTLQFERQKLTKRLEEQALTIHELTLQEEEDEDEDDQSCQCPNEEVAIDFDPGLLSCADSCASPESGPENARLPPTQVYRYPTHQLGGEYRLPPPSRSPDRSRVSPIPNRPKSSSPFKAVGAYGLHNS
jgi:regulator of replication initiation timing